MAAIAVKSRSKSIKSETYEGIESLDQFKEQVSKRSGLSVHRLRITDADKKPITTTSELLNCGGEVQLKDLGPQIGWRTVYLIEYAGPIVAHWLAYRYFGSPAKYDLIWKMQMFHYIKREVENVFVHKFSSSTMPLFNLFKNCGHYWVLGSSLALEYGGIGNFELPWKINTNYVFWFWCFCQWFNAVTHIQLRLLGDKSIRMGKGRKAPEGGFFEVLVAPNYTFEIYGWLAIFLMQPNMFALFFLVVGATQMFFWAQKKNKKYGTKKAFLIPLVF